MVTVSASVQPACCLAFLLFPDEELESCKRWISSGRKGQSRVDTDTSCATQVRRPSHCQDTICAPTLSILLLSDMLATATVVFVLLNIASSVSGDVTVDSCASLLRALHDSEERIIYISGEVLCMEVEDWPVEVNITRNLLIEGEEFGESRLSIPDGTIIHVTEGLYLTFRYILFTVHVLEEGITLPFIHVSVLPGQSVKQRMEFGRSIVAQRPL